MKEKKVCESITRRGYQKYFNYKGSYHSLILWLLKHNNEMFLFVNAYVNAWNNVECEYEYSVVVLLADTANSPKAAAMESRTNEILNRSKNPIDAWEMFNFHKSGIYTERKDENEILAFINDPNFLFSFETWKLRNRSEPIYNDLGERLRY